MEKTMVDMVWVVVASALVFIMQAGFAMVESGMTRSKHSINVAVKNLTDFGVSSIVFWAVGFGLMFGASAWGFIGHDSFLFDSSLAWPFVFFLFQTMFCSTSATIVSGAIAERMRFSSYIITTLILSIAIYPVFGHWVWGGAAEGVPTGWLAKLGFIDFAGSSVVHSVGGWCALAMLLIIGSRAGRFRKDGTVATINGSNIPIAVLGVCLLWFGWFGFNGGSTLAMNGDVAGIIVKTSLAGAAGMIGALFAGWPLYRKPDVNLVLNGALAGLVAITANCHAVSALSAIAIGAVGGVVMIAGTQLLEKLKIDDAVGAIPVHLFAGIWGTLAVAIFGDPKKLATGLDFGQQLGIQALGIAVCGAWAFSIAFGTTWLLNKVMPIRVSPQDEADGLNKAEHGVTTEINDLYQVLDTHAKSGDMRLRAPVEPFTEAGQIAGMYNAVMDKLEENTVAKGDYIQIMRNVGDGMFLLDPQGQIGPYYSAALEKLFASSDLSGRSLDTVLAAFIPEQAKNSLGEFLLVCFDPQFQWRHIERLNPLADVEAFQDDGKGGFQTRNLQFYFRRIEDEGKIDRMLVLVRDVTSERQLSQEVERTREQGQKEMELLYRVLHVEPATLALFLDGVREDLNEINECFRNDSGDVHERLTQIFQLTHAIKGNAELLELGFIGEKAEQFEEQVRGILGQEEPQGEDFLSLTLLFSALNSASEELHTMLGKLQSFRGAFAVSGTNGAHDYVMESMSNMMIRLAERYGKEIDWTATGPSLAGLPPVLNKPVRDIVVQMARNAVYHGIETPFEREKSRKKRAGKVELETSITGNLLKIVIRDDGAGIDTEALKDKAVSAGILAAERAGNLAEKELVPLMFHPGLSTASSADNIAGKGIGMSLVRMRLKELNGRMAIRTRKGLGTEFRFEFPLMQ